MKAALAVLLGCAGCTFTPDPTAETLDRGWSHQWDRRLPATAAGPETIPPEIDAGVWSPLDAIDDPPDRAGAEVLWLRRVVRAGEWRDPVLLLPRVLVAVRVYVDGRLVHREDDIERASGLPLHLVPLPHGDSVVTIRLYSFFPRIGVTAGAYAGDRSALLTALMRSDLPNVVVAVLFLLFGVAALGFSVHSRDAKAFLAVFVTSIAFAAWTMFYTETKQLYADAPAWWFRIWALSVTVGCAGLGWFLERVFDRGPFGSFTWIRRGCVVFVVLTVPVLASPDLLRDVGIPIHVASRVYYVAANLWIIGVLIRGAKRGDPEARIVMSGVALLTLTGTHDQLSSIGYTTGAGRLAHLGLVAFDASLMAVLLFRVRRMRSALDVLARERETMLRDLHDGLGGITTNIRLLADMGRRPTRKDGDPRQTLEMISSLASEGIAEIRALINSLEPAALDWSVLGAELRRLGRLRLEATGAELDFTLRCADGAPPPTSNLALSLCRIYGESMTNVVKHARATKVSVTLEVEPSLVTMVIRDDGTGEAASDNGVGLGRGLENMRARAAHLGGELVVEQAPGTCVRAMIPLPPRAG